MGKSKRAHYHNHNHNHSHNHNHTPQAPAAASFAEVLVPLTEAQKLVTLLKDVQSVEEEWNILMSLLDEVDKMVAMQTKNQDLVSPTQEDYQAFEEWLASNGIPCAGQDWCLKEMGDMGYGVVAKRPIKEGELLMSVPSSVMLSTCNAEYSTVSELFSSSEFFKEFPTVTLACMLLSELEYGEMSAFAPYIRILPRHFTIPLYLNRQELQLFKHSASQRTIVRSISAAISHYCFVVGAIQDLKGRGGHLGIDSEVSFHDFRWALSVVTTRQNAHPQPDGTTSLALIPGFDMVNHEFGQQTSLFDIKSSNLLLNAKRAFVEGEQITMSYGNRDATEFMVYSGFVPPEFGDPVKLKKNAQQHQQQPEPTPILSTIPSKVPLMILLRCIGDDLHRARVNLLRSLGVTPATTVEDEDAAAAATDKEKEKEREKEKQKGVLGLSITCKEPGAHYRVSLGTDAVAVFGAVSILNKEELLLVMRRVHTANSIVEIFGEDLIRRGCHTAQTNVCDVARDRYSSRSSFPLASNALRTWVLRMRQSEHRALKSFVDDLLLHLLPKQ